MGKKHGPEEIIGKLIWALQSGPKVNSDGTLKETNNGQEARA